MRRIWSGGCWWRAPALLAAALLGCRNDPLSATSAAPGEPARVVLTTMWAAGGHEHREETQIDSASQRYTVRACGQAPIGASCNELRPVREGAVIPHMVRDLFAQAASRDFRALKAEYRRPSGHRPPDGGSARLEIVRNATRRVITWESDATLPGPLLEFLCLLHAARGDLLLCD